jgi:hypothetical protein
MFRKFFFTKAPIREHASRNAVLNVIQAFFAFVLCNKLGRASQGFKYSRT